MERSDDAESSEGISKEFIPGGKTINCIFPLSAKKPITIPGVCAHIMVSGIDRGRRCPADDLDRRVLLDLLGRGGAPNGALCYAWCLMDGNYHPVIRCSFVAQVE